MEERRKRGLKRRRQFHTLDHPLRLVIKEPLLTRLKAANDRMPRLGRMLGCMLVRRTVATSDVPTLRAPAEMKPPGVTGRQTLHASVAAWFRSRIDFGVMSLHFRFFL